MIVYKAASRIRLRVVCPVPALGATESRVVFGIAVSQKTVVLSTGRAGLVPACSECIRSYQLHVSFREGGCQAGQDAGFIAYSEIGAIHPIYIRVFYP